MIYEIMSKADHSTEKIHNYLLNQTGNYGENIPELFIDLGNSEGVNGLYAFAIAAIITENFANSSILMSGYKTLELNILSFIQYVKGLAGGKPNRNIDNTNYNTLVSENMIGVSPTLLNLSGLYFLFKDYDETKYNTVEDASENEDTFAYWVINKVHEIETSEVIEKAPDVEWKVPFYVQNNSTNPIKILDSDFTTRIGRMEPSATEAVIKIVNGYGQLASSKSSFIKLSKGIEPFKHMVNEHEIDDSFRIITYPDPPFDIVIKGTGDSRNPNEYPIIAVKGITKNYLPTTRGGFLYGEVVHIVDIFHDIYGITDTGEYIPLDDSKVALFTETEEEINSKKENEYIQAAVNNGTSKLMINEIDIFDSSNLDDDGLFSNPFLIVIDATTIELANHSIEILKAHGFDCSHIRITTNYNGDIFIVPSSYETYVEAQKQKRTIIAITGLKAYVAVTAEFRKIKL